MAINENSCAKLRKVYANLTSELQSLKESERAMEEEGVENPVEIAMIIRGMQETLSKLHEELKKCPPQ